MLNAKYIKSTTKLASVLQSLEWINNGRVESSRESTVKRKERKNKPWKYNKCILRNFLNLFECILIQFYYPKIMQLIVLKEIFWKILKLVRSNLLCSVFFFVSLSMVCKLFTTTYKWTTIVCLFFSYSVFSLSLI